MKDLHQIKDDYANEQSRDSWDEFFSWNELCHTGIGRMQYHHDQITIRYSQEHNKELVGMLVKLRDECDGNNFSLFRDEIEQLIIKHKGT